MWLTIKLHLCCTSSCPAVFRLSHDNFHNATEGRRLVESIDPKNDNYLLMDRAYKYDKTLVMVKAHGFYTISLD